MQRRLLGNNKQRNTNPGRHKQHLVCFVSADLHLNQKQKTIHFSQHQEISFSSAYSQQSHVVIFQLLFSVAKCLQIKRFASKVTPSQ